MSNTVVVISTSGQSFTMPGTSWTADQIVNTYATSVPGIASMASEVTTDQNGDQVITFRPRTGSKG
jgi:hypothetical protein